MEIKAYKNTIRQKKILHPGNDDKELSDVNHLAKTAIEVMNDAQKNDLDIITASSQKRDLEIARSIITDEDFSLLNSRATYQQSDGSTFFVLTRYMGFPVKKCITS
tara:strand:- start:25636 stop:25953 length:318 start_codon:yes stop_codon:yes gene_type:complete